MAIARTLNIFIPVVFWCISLTTSGQYRAPLDSTWLGLNSSKRSTNTTMYFTYDRSSPLGYSAQKLRAQSYQGKHIAVTEKGLWIKMNNELFLYRDQQLLTMSSSKCDFEEVNLRNYDKNLRKTVKALNKLYKKSDYARKIIVSLQKSENKFTISIVNCIDSYLLVPIPNNRLGVLNNNAYAFQVMDREQNVVDYAPFDQIGSGAEIRWGPKHKLLKLAHELSHAYDANFGLLDDRLTMIGGKVINIREIRAIYHENLIRLDMGKKLRTELKNGMKTLVADGVPYTYPLPISARN